MTAFHAIFNLIASQLAAALMLTPLSAILLAIAISFIVALLNHRLLSAVITASILTLGAQYLLILISRMLNAWPDSQGAAQAIRDLVGSDGAALPLTLAASLTAASLMRVTARVMAAVESGNRGSYADDEAIPGLMPHRQVARARAEARFREVLRR